MLEVRTTDDFSFLRQLIADDQIRASIGDDTTPDKVNLAHFLPAGSIVYQVEDDAVPVGVFVFRPAGDDVYEMHTIMGPQCRGRKALQAGRKALERTFAAGASAVVSHAFTDAPASLWFAHQLGFHDTGKSSYPFTRSGRSVELIHLLATHS